MQFSIVSKINLQLLIMEFTSVFCLSAHFHEDELANFGAWVEREWVVGCIIDFQDLSVVDAWVHETIVESE
jgi:hypothetical protein